MGFTVEFAAGQFADCPAAIKPERGPATTHAPLLGGESYAEVHSRSAMDEASPPHPLQISLPIPGIDASPRCQHVGDGIQSSNFDARQNQVRFRLASAPTDSPEPRVSGRGVLMTTQPVASTGAGRTEARKPDRRRRVRSSEYKARKVLTERKRRADRKAQGLCKTCPVIVTTGRTHCEDCLAEQRAYKAERAKRRQAELVQASQVVTSPALPSGPLGDEAVPTRADQVEPADQVKSFENPNGSAYNEYQESGTVEPVRPTVPSPPESSGLQWPGRSVDHQVSAIKPSSIASASDEADPCLLSDATAHADSSQARDRQGGMVPMIVDPQHPTVAPWPGLDDGDAGRTTDRGWHIAAPKPFVKIPGGWITPSQTNPHSYYHLSWDEDGAHCNCPDPAASCKHIRALEVTLERERQEQEIIDFLPEAQWIRDHLPQKTFSTPPNGDAGTVQPGLHVVHADTPAMNLDAPIRQVNRRAPRGPDSPARKRIAPGTEDRKRPTYQQDWAIYNPAHMNMKYHFRHLLRDLVALVEGPVHQRGRRPTLYADQIFCLVYKQYVGTGLRELDTDLREAVYNHYVGAAPSTSTLARYMDDPALTPILHDMILCSAMPMHRYETKFAIDSTGFSSDRFARWFSAKWGQVVEHMTREWVKLHLICGTETGIITCADVSNWRDHDNRYFAPLVADTAEHFDMHQVAADKAYTSRNNYAQVDGLGAVLFAPFKSNVVPPQANDDSAWARMLRLFLTDYDRWVADYHVRSISESGISKLKRLFGDSLYFRKVVAQCNEMLCRIIAYNLTVVIYQMYERDLVPAFHNQD